MDSIRAKLAEGGSIFGTWIGLANTISAEIIGQEVNDIGFGRSSGWEPGLGRQQQRGKSEDRGFHNAECGVGLGHLSPVYRWS